MISSIYALFHFMSAMSSIGYDSCSCRHCSLYFYWGKTYESQRNVLKVGIVPDVEDCPINIAPMLQKKVVTKSSFWKLLLQFQCYTWKMAPSFYDVRFTFLQRPIYLPNFDLFFLSSSCKQKSMVSLHNFRHN
jgi:hypothetical protein